MRHFVPDAFGLIPVFVRPTYRPLVKLEFSVSEFDRHLVHSFVRRCSEFEHENGESSPSFVAEFRHETVGVYCLLEPAHFDGSFHYGHFENFLHRQRSAKRANGRGETVEILHGRFAERSGRGGGGGGGGGGVKERVSE